MAKLNVGIVFGGCSVEHDISLLSAKDIIDFIDKDLFEVVVFIIDKQCKWYLIDISEYLSNIKKFSIKMFLNFIKNKAIYKNISLFLSCSPYQFFSFDKCCSLFKIDVIFPITHGVIGEDGTLQGLLRMINLPFVGSGVLSSAINMNKDIMKRILRDAGFRVAPYLVLSDYGNINFDFQSVVNYLKLPLFIKPVNQGSSIGVSKVLDERDFNKSLKFAFQFSHDILIESFVSDRELTCAVLGNEDLKTSLCGEVISYDKFYTYESKYVNNKIKQLLVPAKVDNKIVTEIRRISSQVFKLLKCSGMARVDCFLTEDNLIVVNELNTLPGFTRNSIYPNLWNCSGLDYTTLITILIRLSIDLHKYDGHLTNLYNKDYLSL